MQVPFWSEFTHLILQILNGLYSMVGSYGLAIVLLTIAMRIVLAPVQWKQTKSMYEMQRIQPKLKALQAKYKNDKEKQQAEMMKFYQENKVNPLGGCLPLLLQMPIFIALFRVLRYDLPLEIAKLPAIQQTAAKSFWIIMPDLTLAPKVVFSASGLVAALPYVIFAVGFAVSTYLPTALMPNAEKQTKTMGLYMSLMMLYIGWISPGGVLLYWVTSSILQIAQQQIQLFFIARTEGA